MADLFDSLVGERLPASDAELVLWRSIEGVDETGVLESLLRDTPWRQERVTLWGRTYPQPRLIAYYGDGGQVYSYSGVTLQPLPWTSLLNDLKGRVEALCRRSLGSSHCTSFSSFNTVLLNYYRDHRDSMGFHADDEVELGHAPTIASLSFGEERRFVMKHRHRDDVEDIKLALPSGSLLVMAGDTQANWKHGVPKQSAPCGPRINLTFRTIRQAK